MTVPVIFVLAGRYRRRFKSGCAALLKFSLRLTQSAFLLSLSLSLSFSSSPYFLLPPSQKNIYKYSFLFLHRNLEKRLRLTNGC